MKPMCMKTLAEVRESTKIVGQLLETAHLLLNFVMPSWIFGNQGVM
jgi:energy-converting hydrogenase Eha subunit F